MRVARLASRSLTLASLLLVVLVSRPVHSQDDPGYRAYAAGDCRTAFQLWSQRAQWDPTAMNALGMLYEQGCGVEQSDAQAMYWYRQAADLGHAGAQHSLGVLYVTGEAVPGDFTEAAKWFRKSAEQGHGYAQLYLGLLYRNGEGVPLDVAEARHWMLLAGEQGVPEARSELAAMQELVREIQEGLRARGFDPGPADGVYGPRTRRAIEEFQRRAGLAVDGNPSEALIEALSEFQVDERSPPSPDAPVVFILILVGAFGLLVAFALRARQKPHSDLPTQPAAESPAASNSEDPFDRALGPVKLTSEGNYYGERGDLDRAISCFQKAISLKADHVPAHLGLAAAHRDRGEYDEAIRVLDAAPRESSFGDSEFVEPEMRSMDFSFQIAFWRASVLVAKHQREKWQGDTSELLAALNEAKRIGEQPMHLTESQREVYRIAAGVDLETERREALEAIIVSLDEIQFSDDSGTEDAPDLRTDAPDGLSASRVAKLRWVLAIALFVSIGLALASFAQALLDALLGDWVNTLWPVLLGVVGMGVFFVAIALTHVIYRWLTGRDLSDL